MTAYTPCCDDEARGNGPFVFYSLLALVILAIMAAAVVKSTGVYIGDHAIKHGTDSQEIGKCLNEKRPYMVYRHRAGHSFYLICQLPDLRWGYQVRDPKGNYKTGFVPEGNGTLKSLLDYLDKFATKFKQDLPFKITDYMPPAGQ